MIMCYACVNNVSYKLNHVTIVTAYLFIFGNNNSKIKIEQQLK